MGNEDVVANALKMNDNPDGGTPELDPESAELLKLFEDTEEEELGVPPPEKAVEAAEPEKEDGEAAPAPEVAPQEEAAAEPEPDSDTSQAEETKAPEAEAPALEIPDAKTAETQEPEISVEDRAKWRAEALDKIEAHYASQLSSEETRDLLLTEPEKALPKVLANAYMDMYDSLMGGVGQALPTQVQQVMQQTTKAQQYESQFFEKWPKLKEAYSAKAEDQQVIQRAILSYRQMNPEVPVQQAIEEAGAMAMVALRIPVDGTETPSASAPADKGFAPASPGGGAEISTPPPAPKKLNEYEQLAQELIDDEEV
jgi:hypothetical protein